ncbi:TPA: hypothetical protein ACOVJJ_001267 [Klebsiella oxytoca]|nr:hypothetical protein [Klebsiella oxytoca]HCQ8441181.1 hypothetical protein [Klebsiella oxytoca]
MTLLEILVRELPKRGGWPAQFKVAHTDGGRLKIVFESSAFMPWGAPWSENMDIEPGIVTREQYAEALGPNKSEWDGNGTPPAGSCFEYQSTQGHWERAKMIFCGKEFAIIDLEGFGESWLSLTGTIFRAARSEEDKRRDEAVQEFVRSIIECVDLHSMHKRQDVIVREKVYSLLPSLPGVTVND